MLCMFVYVFVHACVYMCACMDAWMCCCTFCGGSIVCLDAKWKQKLASAESMCEDLLAQIQSRKHKNTTIIYIMQRVSVNISWLARSG